MEHHCLALPTLNVFRKLTFVYRGVISSVQRLFCNNVLNMSCNLQNTVLKNTIVFWVQNGCKCMACLPSSNCDCWAVQEPWHHERVSHSRALVQEKTEAQNQKYGFY